MNSKCLITIAAYMSLVTVGNAAEFRDKINIVGSFTVYPFAISVGETFSLYDQEKPEIISTGSGGGLKLFCAGVGAEHPDITNASRRMKTEEFKRCQENGITEIIEVIFGFDGLSIISSKDAPDLPVSIAQLTTALAEQGPKPTKWNEIDPSLPDMPIKVFIPPKGTGVNDTVIELVLQKGCEEAGIPCDGIGIRSDDATVLYEETPEGEHEVIEIIKNEHDTFAVMGFSYLDKNRKDLKGAIVEGIAPDFDSVAGQTYPLSRALYFYIKMAHIGQVPGIQEYAAEFMLGAQDSEDGYLVEDGLVPITETIYNSSFDRVNNLTPMTGNELN